MRKYLLYLNLSFLILFSSLVYFIQYHLPPENSEGNSSQESAVPDDFCEEPVPMFHIAEFIARTARTAAAEITAIAVRNTSMRQCIPSETAAVIGSKSARTAATSITPTATAAAIIGRTTALRKLTTTITVTVAALSIAAIATNVTIITARTI